MAIFDGTDRSVYQRTARGGDESACQWLDAPVVVPTVPPVLGFLQHNSAPKMSWSDIILVGMKDGTAADIELKYSH